MEILKAATDWAKAEVFSSQFFLFFGVLFVLTSLGFWQMGKTEVAKAFVYPTLVAGLLLLAIGLGLFFTNRARVTSFAKSYEQDPSAFVQAEISRTEQTMKEYQTIVFKIIPLIIVLAALSIIFMDQPRWRAISITTIALMVVILLVDNNANARVEAYHQQLLVSAL